MSDSNSEPLINDVSDTALWVAVYRAQESERPDALFKDPLAGVLAGERGAKIAAKMSYTKYVKWSLAMRTHIIDRYIREQIAAGVDTILNLGAGLDTRPYRLELPKDVHWIEVDYPQIIRLKEEKLANEKPRCHLERIEMDLSDLAKRNQFFTELNGKRKNILVLTEGVTPYLSEDQVASLAADLRKQSSFRFWITEYYAPQVEKHLKDPRRMKEMKNAPFKFFPKDWFDFYGKLGWKSRDIRYLGEESLRVGRSFPTPWFIKLYMRYLASAQRRQQVLRMTAYVLLEPR